MKTSEEIKKLIDDKLFFLSKQSKTSKEFKSAKKEFDFLYTCLLLVENNLTVEGIERALEKLSAQYQRMKDAYYNEFWYGRSEQYRKDYKRPPVARFESHSGASKIKQQIKTYQFLQC